MGWSSLIPLSFSSKRRVDLEDFWRFVKGGEPGNRLLIATLRRGMIARWGTGTSEYHRGRE